MGFFAFGDVLKYCGKLARPHLERVDGVIELLLFDKLLEGDRLAGKGDCAVCFYQLRALDMGIDIRDAFAQNLRYAQPGVLLKGGISLQEHIVDWFALLIDYYFVNGDTGQGIVKQAAKQRFAFVHTGKRSAQLLLCRAGERPEQHQRTAEQPRGKRQGSATLRCGWPPALRLYPA